MQYTQMKKFRNGLTYFNYWQEIEKFITYISVRLNNHFQYQLKNRRKIDPYIESQDS
jgi:hypothetical protein